MDDLERKIKKLEKKVKNLENPDKKPRKPSEYNLFIKKTIGKLNKEHPDKDHKDIFKKAVKLWSEKSK